jgi:hypothetical protein
MAGAWTTIPIKDGSGTTRNMRVYDEDGVGTAFDWGRREVRGDDGANWSYPAAIGGISNTTTAVTIKTAAGSGIRNYLQSLTIMAETLGTATELAIRDGAAGTVLFRTKIPTGGMPTTHIKFEPPLKGTANTLLEVVTLTASGTGAVYVNASGFTAA